MKHNQNQDSSMPDRIQLFEFTDLAWYPHTFRRMQTDYLQFAAAQGSAHKYLFPLIHKAMQHVGVTHIIDLCSGRSGPWLRLREVFVEAGIPLTLTLTDKFPNPSAVHQWD